MSAAGVAGVTLAAGVAGGIIASAVTGGCAKFGPISFGKCGTSAKINLSNESISESIYKSLQVSQQRIEEQTTIVQNQDVQLNNYNSMLGCSNLKITQGLKLEQNSNTVVTTSMVSDMLNATAQSIENFVNQSQDQIKGALADASDMDLVLEAKNRMVTIINKETTKQQVFESIKRMVVLQNQKIVINFANLTPEVIQAAISQKVSTPEPGTCVIDQNFFGVITISTVLNTVFNEINKDSTINELKQKLDQKQKTENLGIVDTIASFFKSAIFMWMMVALAVIIAIVLVWYFLLKNPEGVKALGSTAQGVMSTARSGKTSSSVSSSK
jgi:hypothetical protein